MARWTINDWNAKIDRTNTVRRIGRNGILYEYELPYGANPMHYYEEAVNVKSIKRSEKYNNGYRIGQYQPVGDKRYFTYYQIRKMQNIGAWIEYIEDLMRRKDEAMLEKLEHSVIREVTNELQK